MRSSAVSIRALQKTITLLWFVINVNKKGGGEKGWLLNTRNGWKTQIFSGLYANKRIFRQTME